MSLNWIEIIIITGAAQGLFLSVFFFHKYRKSTANKILAVFFFAFALTLVEMVMWDIQFFNVNPKLTMIFTGTPFLMGPLLYLYAKYLTHISENFSLKKLFHFVPFILYEIILIPQLLKPASELISNFAQVERGNIPLSSLILNWLLMAHIFVYALFTVLIIRKYSKKIKLMFSSIDKIRLNWLRNMIILFVAEIIIYFIEITLITSGILSNDFAFSSVMAPAFIFIFGYMALIRTDAFTSPGFTSQVESISEIQNEKSEDNSASTAQKYKKSGLSNEKAKEYLGMLLELIGREKPYVNSDLTLNMLSEMISVSPHHLSEVINGQIGQNFFDFINKYRVEKVKTDLADPGKKNLTLLAIALDAGFNSKSSFNSIFKKHTGITPSEYRKNQSE